MAINQLSTSNTFRDWLATTNNLVAVANSLTDGGIQTYITRSYGHANASFNFANTVNVRNQSAYDLSNTTNTLVYLVYNHANAAFANANTLSTFITSVNVKTQSAYDYANVVNTFSTSVLVHADASFARANTVNTFIYLVEGIANRANINAQASFDQSNTVNLHARSAYIHANAGFDFANTVNVRTQSAYDLANTVNVRTQSAYNQTNAAFDKANTDVTNISLVAGTYGNNSIVPVITVESNGRISGIQNTTLSFDIGFDSSSSTDRYVIFANTVGPSQNLKINDNLLFKPSTNTLTVSNVSISGGITENVYSFIGHTSNTIDPKFGTIQVITLLNNTTLTHSIQSGQSVTLLIDDGSDYAITWPTITWAYSSIPDLANTGYTAIGLWRVGSTLYGIELGEY